MSTPPKRFADLEELITLVHSGALPRDTALRLLAEQETSLRKTLQSHLSEREAIRLAREMTLQFLQRIKADQARRRMAVKSSAAGRTKKRDALAEDFARAYQACLDDGRSTSAAFDVAKKKAGHGRSDRTLRRWLKINVATS
jgi:hypothetical protein